MEICRGDQMKEPKGTDLLKTLINLLADQEGLKIKYEIAEIEDEEELKRDGRNQTEKADWG